VSIPREFKPGYRFVLGELTLISQAIVGYAGPMVDAYEDMGDPVDSFTELALAEHMMKVGHLLNMLATQRMQHTSKSEEECKSPSLPKT